MTTELNKRSPRDIAEDWTPPPTEAEEPYVDLHPECTKARAVSEESHAIGEFLDTSGYVLAHWIDCEDYHESGGHCQAGSHLMPVPGSIEKVLADYFKIDLAKVETEKRAMLASIQKANEKRDAEERA